MSDYKALFKAAKAQRETAVPGKLSKEQIRALKAQRAAAAAREAHEEANKREKQGAARAAASAAPPQSKMPPPAPRPAKSSKPVPPPPKFNDLVPFRAESQATIISSLGGDTPSSDASVKGGATVGSAAAASLDAQSTASTNGGGLPSGFFEEPAPSEASSIEAAASQSGMPSGFFDYSAPGPSAGDDSDLAASMPSSEGPPEPNPSTAGRVEGSLPTGFFEETGPGTYEAEETAPEARGGPNESSQAQADGASAIPKGFFADVDADAKARGEKPAKPRTQAETFSDFMASIAADVKEVQAREEEEAADEAAERAEREVFEQRMRLKRVEELKGGAPSSSTGAAAAETLGFNEVALDISSIAEAPVQPRKKRRLDVLEDDPDEGADGEESSEEDDIMLDWRAKTV